MHKLAIVIPAFKKEYLAKALEAISKQSSHDFTLYIGDDHSSQNLKEIVDRYQHKIPLVYHRFAENLGGRDLVAQWERCIDMVREEEWIWLFGDDDMMDANCVEKFYETLNLHPHFDLYRFELVEIDQYDNIFFDGDFIRFPDVLSSEEFIRARLKEGILSSVVEYVFRKSTFLAKGRFQNFDLAWGSDDALWIKLGKEKGIKTIPEAKVYWRNSPYNISPIYRDRAILKRKYYSQIAFGHWVSKHIEQNEQNINPTELREQLKHNFIEGMKSEIEYLSYDSVRELLARFYQTFQIDKNRSVMTLFLFCFKVYRSFVGVVKKVILKA